MWKGPYRAFLFFRTVKSMNRPSKKPLAVAWMCFCLGAGHASPALADMQGAKAKYDFCKTYADRAMSQQSRNLIGQCGREGLKWHGWWEGHRLWCMMVPPERSLGALHERDIELRDCRLI